MTRFVCRWSILVPCLIALLTPLGARAEMEVGVQADPLGIAEFDLGTDHGCARRNNGTVVCWGHNGSGQLGAPEPRGSGVREIAKVTGAAALSVGNYHSCVLLGDRSVVCWGTNLHGQLGNGRSGLAEGPAAVVGLRDVRQITCGGHCCTLNGAGEVHCWGNNAYGQLGAERHNNFPTPVKVEGQNGVVQVAAGDVHTCVRMEDGTIHCFGNNSEGQLGRTGPRGETLQAVPGISAAVALYAGGRQSCARFADGSARCWGTPGYDLPARPEPYVVTGTGPLEELALAYRSACARTTRGEVWCWGDNNDSQLGNGGFERSEVPLRARLEGASQLALGSGFGCALVGEQILCWGKHSKGQLPGRRPGSARPVPVLGLVDVQRLVAAGFTTCAIHTDRTVSCWGYTKVDGTKVGPPTRIDDLAGVMDLVMSDTHACALVNGGKVRCFGKNSGGQLGNGGDEDSQSAVDVAGLRDVERLVAGGIFTCAIVAGGKVWCWGAVVSTGLLGSRPKRSADHIARRPKPVVGLSDVREIAAGFRDACAIMGSGNVRCWGRHRVHGTRCHTGEDDGTVCTHPPPIWPAVVKGVSGVTAMRVFYQRAYFCAEGGVEYEVALDARPVEGAPLLMWGNTPSRYQVGARASLVPESKRHQCNFEPCRLADNGTVLCYGSIEHRQADDPIFARINSLTAIPGLQDATQVVTGHRHACALMADLTVRCWGDNTFGQLGPDEATNLGLPGPITIEVSPTQ